MNRILKWKRLKGFFFLLRKTWKYFLQESGGNVDCGIQKFVGKGEKFPLLGPGETSPFPLPVSKVSLISRILFFSEVLKGEEGCTFFSFVVLLSRALVQQAKQGRDMSHTPQSCKCMPAAFYGTVKAKKCIHSVWYFALLFLILLRAYPFSSNLHSNSDWPLSLKEPFDKKCKKTQRRRSGRKLRETVRRVSPKK